MAQDKMTLEDWLDDLCVRFIINLPREDLESVARICFQIEEAQWFYEDFIRPLDPTLPSMSLRNFSLKMFQHCPLLASFSAESHIKAFEEFLQYKIRVPVRGAIMLNDNMDAAVLVRGYKKGASWSFPRGKINKDEDDLDCAIREVYEETGYDLRESGLVDKNEPVHPLEVTMHDQQVRLYVFRGIPEDTVFETRTRKEIGAIKWYKVEELPAYRKKKGAPRNNGASGPSHDRFYMVAPFIAPLRQWVLKQKKLDQRKVSDSMTHHHPQPTYDDNLTDDNVVHEPVQEPAPMGSHAEYIDSATKELRRLLKVKPPTQGLQILSQNSDQNAGQALMSLLQSGRANEREVSAQAEDDDAQTPNARLINHQHRHPEQQVPVSNYGAPPRFSTEANSSVAYASQHRARPYVNVSTEVPNPPAYSEQPRQSRNQPVQLVHPQPLPPQVQKAMLLRGMASSPQIADHSAHRQAPAGLSQDNQYNPQGQQVYQRGMQDIQPQNQLHSQLSAQLPAHSSNLLNVLKGNAGQPDAGQRVGPESFRQPINVPTEHNHQHQFPAQGSGFASQYGAPAIPSGFNASAANGNHGAPLSSNVRPLRPTDKHRAGLLDMFKRTEPSVAQNQLDGEGVTRRPSQPSDYEKQQQWPNQSQSTASALQAAAQETGRPMQVHPEANLPFRALSILSRPKPGQSPSENASVSARSATDNAARYAAAGSQSSPRASSFQTASPSFTNASPRLHQMPPQKTQPAGQLSPGHHNTSTHSYPYGSSQGSQPNPLLFPSPPSTSALPVPGSVQFRQDSTAEQRNHLLSLFGKPKSNFEQSKGKEAAMPDQFTSGSTPRSRLPSVASSGGEGIPPLRGNGSRRGSQPPLSPADRNFLLNFLQETSSGARR
ncbi:hypothetical protein F5Y05DRAFT_29388 [Hypoxylon sp. FL0543]|nr:hypothetical protein F5Y05DRAFT_29388 [Hypoxylon sp. FL0543]